jgi:N-acetylglucosamine-6-phosphate deacetylase
MNGLAFRNGSIVTPQSVLPAAEIVVEAGSIVQVLQSEGPNALDLEGGWLLPGFIDTQVNGGGGVLFNDDVSVAAIARIGEAHARFGTTGFLPTLISDRLSVVASALDVVDDAIDAEVPGVIGIHLEGPFLNPRRKGVHEEEHFVRLDAEAMDLLTRPRRGAVMITLAPELCEPADIAALAAAGVRVSAGHTDATYDEMNVAITAGLVGVTHLFNAMSPLHHRDLGVVGAALESRRLWCGLIADGAHVHPAALRIAQRLLPTELLMLVTDAMPSVGASEKDFVLQGKPITVSGGICSGPDGQLAGSDLDMAQAVANVVRWTEATVQEASRMASASPAAFLGLSPQRGALTEGLRADWVCLDADLKPRATWIGGRRITPF